MNTTYNKIYSILKEGKIALLETALDGTYGDTSSGMKKKITTLSSPKELAAYEEDSVFSSFAYLPPERLIVLGGGHIAQPLEEFASKTGFQVIVVDDRPKFANTHRFPHAKAVLCDDFTTAINSLHLTANDYVTVVTRGHKEDETCLKAILSGTFPAYAGLIGSKRRVFSLKEKLVSLGYSKELLDTIHTPIGLSIGAQTPEEIAVSILAELIQVKRTINPMKPKGTLALSYDTMGFFKALQELKEPYAIVTITSTKGSTPRKAGSIMAVTRLGITIGSIGGGCSESKVITDARRMVGTSTYKTMTLELTSDFENEDGMVCGGTMEVLIEA